MRRCLLSLVLLAIACGEKSATPVTDTREAIAVEYVKAHQATAHSAPKGDAPVTAHFANGESVSVLSSRDGWTEVRVLDGSGWVRQAEIERSSSQGKEPDNLTPRFRVAPTQVTNPSDHGELVLEAGVNSEGDVTSVRTLKNETGSHLLEVKNTAALQSAHFYPIVQHGKRTEFIYEYRLHY